MKVSAVILNYNDSRRVIDLALLLEKQGIFDTIVIPDNGSDEANVVLLKELDGHPSIRVILNQKNLWFSGGNNIALQSLSADEPDYVCLINSDIVVESDVLQHLLGFLESHPDYGVSTCQMMEYGKPMQCHYDFPTVRHYVAECLGFTKLFHLKPKHIEHKQGFDKVDYARSSLWMVRYKSFSEVGFFDEGTKLYHIETCVGLKMKGIGKSFAVLPEDTYQHNHIYKEGYKMRGYRDTHASVLYIFREYLNKNRLQLFICRCAYGIGLVIRKICRIK